MCTFKLLFLFHNNNLLQSSSKFLLWGLSHNCNCGEGQLKVEIAAAVVVVMARLTD